MAQFAIAQTSRTVPRTTIQVLSTTIFSAPPGEWETASR